MSAQIPDEIKYMLPLIEELDKFNSEELNEDNQEAMDLVEKALESILKDLSEEEAVDLLKNHVKIIQEWLEEIGTERPSIGYVQGALMGMLAFKYNDYDILFDNK